MNEKKFDPQKLQKLNNPQRLIDIPPDFVRGKLNIETAAVLVEIGAGTAFFSCREKGPSMLITSRSTT